MTAPADPRSARPWLFGALLVLATVLPYVPALRGGFIWDDDHYVVGNPAVLSPDGLARIWLAPASSPQYYPVTMTTFWLEHRLFGGHPFGYHLTNVLLHVANALLIGAVLRRLGLPGASLAAALFALHPVHVESVAWITERKNVLSGFFYLLAFRAWLRFAPPGEDDRGAGRFWLLSFSLFLCALLSKSVTGTLPAAVLLLTWWKRGRIDGRDVVPLLPFFAAAAGMGGVTAWIEKHRVGAWGPEWDLSFLERLLVAGRAPWFYLGKLFWPSPLLFIYPRWNVDVLAFTQYVYPLGAALACLGAWVARERIGRGPLTAFLFFLGTLFPALSFVNVFPMLYSFVADHFQYLASIGPIALVAAWAATVTEAIPSRRFRPTARAVATAAALTALATTTWSHATTFSDSETLWRETLKGNAGAWMAHTNLASYLHVTASGSSDAGTRERMLQEAERHYRTGLDLKPDNVPARIQLAKLYEGRGELARAAAEYEAATRIPNRFPPLSRGYARAADPWYAYGRFLADRGDAPEAIACYRRALRILPDSAPVRTDLGKLLFETGRPAEAKEQFLEALRVDPDSANAANNLAVVLGSEGNLDGAVELWERTLRADPNHAEAHNNLGKALVLRGDTRGAIHHFRRAVEIRPDDREARRNLEDALRVAGGHSGFSR